MNRLRPRGGPVFKSAFVQCNNSRATLPAGWHHRHRQNHFVPEHGLEVDLIAVEFVFVRIGIGVVKRCLGNKAAPPPKNFEAVARLCRQRWHRCRSSSIPVPDQHTPADMAERQIRSKRHILGRPGELDPPRHGHLDNNPPRRSIGPQQVAEREHKR